jgi:kumamolisin
MPAPNNYQIISGTERSALPESRVVGKVDPSDLLTVTIKVRRASAAGELRAHVMATGQKKPKERTYLTREQFVSEHGATAADIAKVVSFAHQHGLTVVESSRAKRSVKLTGTIAALTAAFRVELHQFQKADLNFRGRVGSISVPAELLGIVVGVHGFDNRPVASPHYRRRESPREMAGVSPHNASNGSLSPLDVANLYNFPAGLDGTGQCIGVIELNSIDPSTDTPTGTGFNQADLQTFFSNLGLPTPQVLALSVDRGANVPGPNPNADGEVTLDIEVAGAVAPGSKIAVYFAPNTAQGFVDALTQAVHDTENAPSVISISWGAAEDFQLQQMLDGLEQALEDAAALGITVCCASGDNGSADMPLDSWDGVPHVDFPASSPFALACGGTKLIGSGTNITEEAVWNEGDQGGGGGGGGVSNKFARPDYQSTFNIPASPSGNNGRGLPDVSGDADPATGYEIFLAGNSAVIGGTSAVAPLWAGLIARMNQRLVSIGSKPVGFLNPVIYRTSGNGNGAFRDVTVGNNDLTGTLNGLYPASPGWDAATGFGTPNGTNLLKVLGG